MDFDIRLPIGALFMATGALLAGYGLVVDPAVFARHSLGLNVDLGWGAAMAAFGVLMLAVALLRRRPR